MAILKQKSITLNTKISIQNYLSSNKFFAITVRGKDVVRIKPRK